MTQMNIVALLAPCLVAAVACAQADPEPPLTPASYTQKLPSTPSRSTQAAAAPRSASRRMHEAQSSAKQAAEDKAPAPVVTGTEGNDSRTAITLARCEREARCNQVGEDKEYVTEEDCIARLEPNTERELEASNCPRAIASGPLGACMEAIRKESCDRPRSLESVDKCAAATLCSKR